MTIIASDQISISDLTDAYTVNLSQDAIAFQCDTSSEINGKTALVSVSAKRGATTVPVIVDILDYPSGVEVTNNGASPSPTITILLTALAPRQGLIDISIYVEDVTFEKTISYSVAVNGEDGESPYVLKITSTDGLIFRNTAIYTDLQAYVYYGNRLLNNTEVAAIGTINWYRIVNNVATLVGTGSTYRVSSAVLNDDTITIEGRLED